MAPGAPEKKVEKSYLSSAVDSINPWANSRTTTPTPGNRPGDGTPDLASAPAPAPGTQTPGDHAITPLYGQSFRTYPADCPPLNVKWFHAVDIPKRKPQLLQGKQAPKADAKPLGQPKKHSPFSVSDSRRIEANYQKLLEAVEDRRGKGHGEEHGHFRAKSRDISGLIDPVGGVGKSGVRVPVNEDYLFDVDILQRELGPVYWLGPVYEVRRGIWFFQEGSVLRPCEENLAAQLEEGYLKTKPWLQPVRARSRSGSREGRHDTPEDNGRAAAVAAAASALANKATQKPSVLMPPPASPIQPQSHRLFGTYMNSIVTYHDSTTAWLSSGSMLSWVTTSVYERFAGGGYMSGVKLVRGYTEPTSTKEKEKDDKTVTPPAENIPGLDERQQKLLKRRSAPASTGTPFEEKTSFDQSDAIEAQETKLQRQISSLMEHEGRSTAEAEEELQRRQEQEIQDDYNAQAGEAQGRDIEHLVLVTHGIGQLLGLRMESVNFVHDVNVLRKTMKSVYTQSADLKALNSELGGGPGNCRVQVLPVCWRHLLNFPRQRERKGEHDLGDVDGEEDEYPSLEDITVEGAAFARSLISDLALDVLLYQSSYREEISRIVLGETNRILKLFKERNPQFNGKVHVMGHSLGSAIYFDILCRQKERRQTEESRNPLRFWPSQGRPEPKQAEPDLAFDFDVHDFYCLGSPVGLFQMLKGRTIAARQSPNAFPAESPLNPDTADDPFLTAQPVSTEQISPISGLPISVSSPKVEQMFNIFHPSDPISYRLEPLISPAMASLKSQPLPYTKRGIFGNVAHQGFTGIGAKVGQSVSGLWSSLSAGVASNLLNRSLGLTSEEVARMAANQQQQPGGGSAGGQSTDADRLAEKTDERQRQLAEWAASGREDYIDSNPALIDEEMETLYSTFQKKHAGESEGGSAATSQQVDRKARKLRAEEAKVRALNRNGRVDYSIQEGALDFNPINTIASHMGYWADADVNHFVLSQLLSNPTKRKRG